MVMKAPIDLQHPLKMVASGVKASNSMSKRKE
jgi:hypothetical protein